MRCKHCGKRYGLDWGQPAPGGSSSPGYFFWFSTALFGLTVVLYWLGLSPWHWVALGVAVFVLVQVPIAFADCTSGDYSGEQCPNCKAVNRAFWWSL